MNASLSKERIATLSLAAIMGFRMLGLFMILPVFAVQATHLAHANVQLIGIALGIYGFTQACLQMPLGLLSDRIGRKPVIAGGLLLFAVGSIFAACSHDIYSLILGRALQGAGAIGSTVLALLADLTRDENRSKAMALVGLVVGSSFSLAMILGPLINTAFQLTGIFWCTAGFALTGLAFLYFTVPAPPQILFHQSTSAKSIPWYQLLTDRQLLRLNLGIFTLHATLTASFLAIPILLHHFFHLSALKQSLFYLIILAAAFLLMLPGIILAEKKQQLKVVFTSAIALLLFSQLLLFLPLNSLTQLAGILLLFFTAFTSLEAILPSWISKVVPITHKGAAMGIYSSFQFFGIFCGGIIGGWAYNHFALPGILFFTSLSLLFWLVLAWQLQPPPYLSTVILQLKQFVSQDPQQLSHQLKQIPAIAEVAIMPQEGLVYLKVKPQLIKKDELPKQLEKSNLLFLAKDNGII